MLIHNLNEKTLQSAFSLTDYKRGQDYFIHGHVIDLKINKPSKDHEIIEATVQGQKIYTVHVELNAIRGTVHLWGSCACPLGGGCKHVVATLLKALEYDPVLEEKADEMDEDVADWLKDLNHTFQQAPQRRLPFEDIYRLFYILSPASYDSIDLHVKIVFSKRLKSGKWGTPKEFYKSHNFDLQTIDQELLIQLEGLEQLSHHYTRYGYYPLDGEISDKILETLISTQRCHWESVNAPILTLGEPKKPHWHWQKDKKGFQTLRYHTNKDKYEIYAAHSLWYLQEKTGKIGLLDTDIDKATTVLLLSAPVIPPAQAEKVANAFVKHKKRVPIQPPKIREDKEIRMGTPTPCLHLYEAPIRQFDGAVQNQPSAVLTFNYEGIEVSEKDGNVIIENINIQRDTVKEASFIKELARHGWHSLRDVDNLERINSSLSDHFLFRSEQGNIKQNDLLQFSSEILPQLRDQGWRIDINPNYPYRLIDEPIDDWYSSIDEGTDDHGAGYDWFNLELGITVKGEKINLLPVLQRLLPTLKDLKDAPLPPASVYAQLSDGRYIPLPAERVQAILNVLIELYDGKMLNADEKLKLSQLHAMRLLDLEKAMGAAKLRWLGGERLRKMAEKLSQFKGIQTVKPPAEFQGTLRHYQIEGLSWLQFLREYELSGILADDMGLGKTVQALSHILLEKISGRMKAPSLIAAPTSLMFNWLMETKRFAPDLNVLVLHGSERKHVFDNINQYDLILTTYSLLVRDQAILLKQPFYFFILDEAQFIKNAKTQAAQVALQIKARHRLCLTGTPMENHLGELWSLFHFMMPGLLGEQTQFTRLFRTPIEKHNDQERREHLNRRIAPFMLRRTKDKVIKELPDKVETIHYIELEGPQRDLYETIRITMQKKIRDQIAQLGFNRSHIVILEALLKLRQVCCDPRLLKIPATQKKQAKSAKLALLMSFIAELLEEGRRILLFSQFTEMLGLIEEELAKEKIAYVKLTGQTKDRQTPVEQFQAGEVPLFLISLKAGGTGLNLTAADTVIHYDPWWNPAVENQATDRAHRIGQNKTVFVYKFVAKGTVEEKILDMQKNKRVLMESLFSENTDAKFKLTEDDLKNLFDPLVG